MLRILITTIVFLNSSLGFAVLPVGTIPPELVLQDKDGGKVKGGPWKSSEIKDKVHVLFYVAPGEKDLNKEATDALKMEKFPLDKYASIAVVNMAASWLPDFAIAKKLEESQKEFPDTLYVKDINSSLVKNWNLKDNSSDVVVFDRTGKVVFSADGKLNKTQIEQLIQSIKSNL